MPELGTLGRRDAAALAGLAPWTRQSGEWKGKSFISGGRKIVRTALYMGALVAAQHNQTLKAFRNRLVGDGKPKKLAIIAVARKLLTMSLVAKGPGNGPDKPPSICPTARPTSTNAAIATIVPLPTRAMIAGHAVYRTGRMLTASDTAAISATGLRFARLSRK